MTHLTIIILSLLVFSDSVSELVDKIKNRYTYGKSNYQFFIYDTLIETSDHSLKVPFTFDLPAIAVIV